MVDYKVRLQNLCEAVISCLSETDLMKDRRIQGLVAAVQVCKEGNEANLAFEVQTKISDNQVKNLLCSALEGGSNYWYNHKGYEFPEGISYQDFQKGGKFTDPGNYYHPSQLIPLHPGCAMIFTVSDDPEREDQEFRLNRESIQKGLQVMQEKYSGHFGDFLSENDDATTGDVFLQCCLFGELIYG